MWPLAAAALGGGLLWGSRKNFCLLETKGTSMVPTIPASGAVVLVDRYLWRLQGAFMTRLKDTPVSMLKRDDVIVFKQRRGKRKILACKRIAGVEGETIEREGVSFYVPQGHIWVEGDRKSNSRDSRSYGSVDVGLVVGKVTSIKK